MAIRYKKAGINAFDQTTFYVPKPLKGYSIESSFDKHHANHTLLSVIDGDPESYFWSNRSPKKGDTVTINFETAQKAQKVSMQTGHPSTYKDLLEFGVLEASTDGQTWQQIAEFKKGIATGNIPEGTKKIRLRCTKRPSKPAWLQVYSFELKN